VGMYTQRVDLGQMVPVGNPVRVDSTQSGIEKTVERLHPEFSAGGLTANAFNARRFSSDPRGIAPYLVQFYLIQ
tara:strand:+ start:24058 stop:24279 length:222 start_codon:yes stop_codon:yes gene_type:complete